MLIRLLERKGEVQVANELVSIFTPLVVCSKMSRIWNFAIRLRKKKAIGLCQKPLNVTKRKPQNRNIFHSKPTTAIKAREDVYAVEAHIFRRETGKHRTPSNHKSEKPILFLPKTWKPRATDTTPKNRFFFNAKAEKPI